MKISYDPAKRDWTLRERNLDFLDAPKVFDGPVFSFVDTRHSYGEVRMISIGYLDARMVMLGWTQRDLVRHVFTMRRCNDREQKKYGRYFVR